MPIVPTGCTGILSGGSADLLQASSQLSMAQLTGTWAARNILPPNQPSDHLRGLFPWEIHVTCSSPAQLGEKQSCMPSPVQALRNIPLAGVVLLGKSTASAPGSSGSFLPSKGKQGGVRHLLSPPTSAQQLFARVTSSERRAEAKPPACPRREMSKAVATLQAVCAQLAGMTKS